MDERKIIHIDMDAFYASVEMLDNPELRDKPIAVGWDSQRSVILTANYAARKFGVKSAMSAAIGAQKCPDLIFVPPRFPRYKEISNAIHEIFYRYTDVIEPLSLDEAYLDVTYNKLDLPSATLIAQMIKNDIRREISLVASAGVSYNKFLAKIASDQDKPDGLFVILPNQAIAFLENLPIHLFYGVGKVTADKFRTMGVHFGRDLKELSLDFLVKQFGKSGAYFYSVVRGIDDRVVQADRTRKSVGMETTFDTDIFDYTSFYAEAAELLTHLWKKYGRFRPAKTLTLKLKFTNFKVITRSNSVPEGFLKEETAFETLQHLVEIVFPLELPVRLIGVQFSNFLEDHEEEGQQLTLNF